MKRAALLIVALFLPTAVADDTEAPLLLEAWLDDDTVANGAELVLWTRWADDSGVQRLWINSFGPNEIQVAWNCDASEDPHLLRCAKELPARAPAGTYRFTHVFAYDTVGHSQSHSLRHIAYTVDSPHTDTEAPIIHTVTQNVDSLDMRTQEYVDDVFSIQYSEEGTIQHANLRFVGPNGNGQLTGNCQADNGEASCRVRANSAIPSGTYKLFVVRMADDIGYDRWYQGDDVDRFGSFSLDVVTNVEDTAGPVLEHITFPDRVFRGETMTIDVSFIDDHQLDYLWIQFQTSRGNAELMLNRVQCTGNWEPVDGRDIQCDLRIPVNFPLGLVRLLVVEAKDTAGNYGRYRPAEWASPYQRESFANDALHDVGFVIVPRTATGVLERVDSILNEVAGGDVAQIVFDAADNGHVELVLEDTTSGATAVVSCRTEFEGLNYCDLPIPDGYEGLLTLREARSQNVVTTYDLPILAVDVNMPDSAFPATDSAGGRRGEDNNIGAGDYIRPSGAPIHREPAEDPGNVDEPTEQPPDSPSDPPEPESDDETPGDSSPSAADQPEPKANDGADGAQQDDEPQANEGPNAEQQGNDGTANDETKAQDDDSPAAQPHDAPASDTQAAPSEPSGSEGSTTASSTPDKGANAGAAHGDEAPTSADSDAIAPANQTSELARPSPGASAVWMGVVERTTSVPATNAATPHHAAEATPAPGNVNTPGVGVLALLGILLALGRFKR